VLLHRDEPHQIGLMVGTMDGVDESRSEFKPIGRRATWVFWIFIVLLVVDVIAIVSDLSLAETLRKVMAGWTISPAELAASDEREAAIGVVQTMLLVASAIAFLMWVHRAYRNLPSLGAKGLRFTPGWAVGWFFVPVMCLFRPYQAMSEIWRASLFPSRDLRDDGLGWKRVPTSPLVGWWWAVYLIANWVGWLVLRMSATAMLDANSELSDFLTATYLMTASDVLDVVYIPAALVMVKRITRFQEAGQRFTLRAPKTPERVVHTSQPRTDATIREDVAEAREEKREPLLERVAKQLRPRYCEKCGSQLQVRRLDKKGFDKDTGQPKYEVLLACPHVTIYETSVAPGVKFDWKGQFGGHTVDRVSFTLVPKENR